MTIYLDIVFFENIAMNYLILMATSIIAKVKINSTRLLLAGTLGGIYSIITYFIELSGFQNLFLKILISIVIVKISFNPNKLMYLFRELILFYLVSFTFGGAAFMFLYFINPANIMNENGVLVGTYPLKVTLIGAVIGFAIISSVAKIVKDRISKKAMLRDLEIFYQGKMEKIKTLIDTGNLLKDPITSQDVIIVEKEVLKNLVSSDILENIENIVSGKWLNSESVYEHKFKIIPFSSLGNDNGILLGFKPDYIRLIDENETVKSNIVIGIYDGKLSKNNLYNSLIGINILKEESGDGKYVKSN